MLIAHPVVLSKGQVVLMASMLTVPICFVSSKLSIVHAQGYILLTLIELCSCRKVNSKPTRPAEVDTEL